MSRKETHEALAQLLAECPHLYTVNDYGAVGPGEESVEAYATPGGVVEWLIARGVTIRDEVSEAAIEAALREIAEKDGLCIYGCHEMVEQYPDRSERDDYGKWFRMGSADAFAECADIAKKALGSGRGVPPQEKP